ncbi:MAG: insulinase family protein [Rhodobacterales bacterium]|nr:insulinase family protein [Rhodobacterales bacterium]
MTVQTEKLENGFRIVTEHMPGLQSASVGIWVDAGGRHERLEQNGIAHFLEHMAFKGTSKRSALDIAEAIEDVGGYINAYTSREVTAYYVRLLKENIPLAIDILADILKNSIFDKKEIEVERNVILQEIGQSLDTPDDIIFDWLQETAYPDQPMGRTILGPAEKVRKFDKRDLSNFVSENYSPDRLILAAAGGVKHEEIVSLAKEQFGSLKSSKIKYSTDPINFKGGEFRREKELEQAHMALAFDGPSYVDDALIYAGTSEERLKELSELTFDELKRAADNFSQSELDRARAQMKAGLLMGLESASSRAERLARMISIWDRVPTLEETVKKIDAINLNDMRRYAEKIAVSSKTAMALYGPVGLAPDLSELEIRRAA